MDNWYCKEFISSSQTAARLVFNINNCVDLSKVLQLRPNRPPDAKGRESFVYIMDGAVVRSIKDLPIDELTPWNSKKCKSSTRFSSVQFDGEKNSLVFNRYIISDSGNVDRPECLLACYYCKHPVFNLVKKIYYACDANRERCLPGTFVIFIYEFAHAESLYRTYGAYRISSNHTMVPIQSPKIQTPMVSQTQIPNSQPVQPMTNSIQRHFENGTLKFEDFILDGNGSQGDEGYEMDSYLQSTPNTSCLEDILEACNSASLKRNATSSGFSDLNYPTSSAQSTTLIPQVKRIKRSNSEQPENEEEASAKSGIESSTAHESANQHQFRYFFTTDALVENFRKNCLCDVEELCILLDKIDDQVVKDAENMDNDYKNELKEDETDKVLGEAQRRILGGCLLIDSSFCAENLHLTVLWFRNSTFLDPSNQPLVHPVAALISSELQPDDQQYLLNQFAAKLAEIDDNKGICRSMIADCPLDSDFPITSPLFSYPCIRIVSIDQLKQILHQKFADSEELLPKVEEDLFRPGTGLLNSLLSFEHFVRKLRTVEKGWPNGFRMWFREKSGWIFERSSLVAHIKAGLSIDTNEHFSMTEALAPLKAILRQNLAAAVDEFCDNGEDHLSLESAISTVEQYFTDILIKVVHSLTNSSKEQSNGQVTLQIHPSKVHLWVGSQWTQLSVQERRESLSAFGLSALSAAGSLSHNSLDPLIFAGLSRSQKMDLVSRANTLDVLNLPDCIQKQRFIVENISTHQAFFVQNESKTVHCQCRLDDDPDQPSHLHLCEHILAIALKDGSFARRLGELISQNRARTATSSLVNVNGLQLDSSPIVEIICCSSNGTT